MEKVLYCNFVENEDVVVVEISEDPSWLFDCY